MGQGIEKACRGYQGHHLFRQHERKVELPKDKTELMALILDIGEYERLSGVNTPN